MVGGPSTFNPKDPRTTKGFKTIPSAFRYLLPVSVVFMFCGVAYSIKWSQEQRESPCIDCHRQKEIADEIYFGKKPKTQSGGCRIGGNGGYF